MVKSSSLRVAIGRIPMEHTTALYFERALLAAGHEVTVIHDPSQLGETQPFDLFIAVDPWLKGIRVLPRLSCPTVAVLIDVHLGLPIRALFAKFVDHAFIAQCDYLNQLGAGSHDSVHWLPLGGDLTVHFVPDLPRDFDVGFVGQMGKPGSERHTVLSHVLSRFKTNEIGHFCTPREMGRIYSSSRIVLNKSIRGDVNMRVFEALAAGALLVTDRIGNGLNELLTEGVHYVGYDSAEEAVAQIERYLGAEEERARIARAGQDLFRKRHTYDLRLAAIIAVVQAAGVTRPAPARKASTTQRLLWCAQLGRLQGISASSAYALVAEGMPPAGYADLAMGFARRIKRGSNLA